MPVVRRRAPLRLRRAPCTSPLAARLRARLHLRPSPLPPELTEIQPTTIELTEIQPDDAKFTVI
jgi:hypothetical protein